MCQLLLTGAIISLFQFHEGLKGFIKQNPFMCFLSYPIAIITLIIMICCDCNGQITRKFPTNIIFLGIFTLALGYMLGSVCALYEAEAVLVAVVITVIGKKYLQKPYRVKNVQG